MESAKAAREFSALYRRIYFTFYQRHAPTEYEPSPEALAILQHLAVTGPLTVGEAAKHFSRSQAATSELIARLEKRGYLERVPDERDRRRHLIWLTPEGLRRWERATQVLSVESLAEAFGELEPERRSEVLVGLGELLKTTNRRGEGPTPDPLQDEEENEDGNG